MSHSAFRIDPPPSVLQAALEAESDQQPDPFPDPPPYPVSSTLWKNVTSLVPPEHRLSPDQLLERFILHHLRLDGARALRWLMRHPDRPFSAQAIWQALSGFNSDESDPHEQSTLLESSIPLTDSQSLHEVRRELLRLHRHRESVLCLRGDVSALDHEIAALQKYLRDSFYPDGRPRAFNGTEYKASQALSLCLKRFRQRVASLDPQLCRHIESHLVTTPTFIWRS